MRAQRISRLAALAAALVACGPPASAAADGGESVAFQVNPGHTGFASGGSLDRPPLDVAWTRTLGAPAPYSYSSVSTSYPLVAGGRVFVIAYDPQHAGGTLYALDAASGTTDWARGIDGSGTIAYDAGRVFISDNSGAVVSVSAATGATEWARALPQSFQLQSPVASGGVLYVDTAWDGGGLYALNETDGSTRWIASGWTEGNPAIAGGLAYVSDDYEGATSAFSLLDGSLVWSGTPQCFVGSGHVVADGARLIGPWNSNCGTVLDGGTGAVLDTIASSAAPASAGDVAVVLDGSTLQGRSLESGVLLWQFAGDQTLSSPPVIVNGTVYEGSSSGTLFAVDLQTGAEVWSGSVAAAGTAVGTAGMAAGDGLLVVPSAGTLTGLESAVARPGLDVHVDSGPDGPTVAHTATLSFSSDDPTVPEQCRLDAGAWAACDASVAYAGLASGPHMFEVETVDPTDASTIGLAVRGWSVVTSLPGSGSAGSGGTTGATGTTSTPAPAATPTASSASAGAGATATPSTPAAQTDSPASDRARTAAVGRLEDTALARSLAAATAVAVQRRTHAGLRARPAIHLYSRGAETVSITLVAAAKGRQYTLGSASARFAATGSRNVRLVLSPAGRAALAGRARLSLIVRASVAPAAGTRVSASANARV